MIHDKKATHGVWGVKTGISLNYYYGEGKTSYLLRHKIILKQKAVRQTSKEKKNKKKIGHPGIVIAVATSTLPRTWHTGLLHFLSAPHNHISGQSTPKGLREAGLMNRLIAGKN